MAILIVRDARAQSPADWEVLRIYVPAEEVGDLVPRDYSPIEIEDLSEALEREAERRSQSRSAGPHIAEATYVVRCNGEQLVSDQSRWHVRSHLPSAAFVLEDISIALHNSLVTPADDKPLLPNLRYSTEGRTTLAKIAGDTNYWLGWSATPTSSNGSQSSYDLRLPAATLGRMLITAPADVKITSPDVIVNPVENPRDFLPAQWPELAASDGQRWHLLHVSGKSRFRLTTEVSARADRLAFQQFVRRSTLVYKATDSGLIANADFEIERIPPNGAIQLLIGKTMRLRSVTVDGALVSYQIANAIDNEKIAIELPANVFSGAVARVRVEAIVDTAFPFNDVLPTVEIAAAFTWEGRTTLASEDDLAVEQMSISNRDDLSKPQLETTTVGKRWTADWLGAPPQMRASISRTNQEWKASSFTRLTVQQDWIAATTNLQMTCKQLKSNELRLRIGEGWFIDDLTVGKSDFPINAQLPDGEAGDVILTWDRINDEMSINLQLVAHLPRATDVEQFTLLAPRVVTVADAKQEDHYALEQTSRFQVQPDAQLQRLQLRETDLPPWQLKLLSTPSAAQLYRGLAASVPPLVLNRSSGTYSAKVKTIARSISGHLQVEYSVEFLPTAGAIMSASCLLNVPAGVTAPIWRVTQEHSGAQIQIANATVTPNRDDSALTEARGETRFEVQLPDASAAQFTLHGELLLPSTNPSLALPLVTTAVATDTWLILPRHFSVPHSALGLVALPSSICCEAGELTAVLEDEAESMVAYRYDPSIVSSIELRPTARLPDEGAWIWTDATEHWLYGDGRIAHRTDLQIFAPESISLVVHLPLGWIVNRVMIDDQTVAISPQVDSNSLPLSIPRGERVQVSLQSTSQNGAPNWFTRVDLPKPICSLPSLDSSETLWLQPGAISLNEVFLDASNSRAERLHPSNWWRWLSPTQLDASDSSLDNPDAAKAGESFGWRRVVLAAGATARAGTGPSLGGITRAVSKSNAATSGLEHFSSPTDLTHTARVAILERASLCSLCIALLLACAAGSYSMLGNRFNRWWLTLTFASAAVLVVPPQFVGGSQLFLLSLVCGALARLMCVVTIACIGRNGQPNRRGSTVVRSSAIASILVAFTIAPIGFAQKLPTEAQDEKSAIIYGVLIPLNEDGQLSAKHVYAPRKLMNLLNGFTALDKEEEQPQILGAKYLLRLRSDTSLTTSYVQEFTVEFDLLFNSTEFALRLPIKSTQLQLLRGSVAGQEVYIGPSLQQTADAITYRPPETGRVRLRLQLIPTTTESDERTNIEVGIPKIASSNLEVLADDALEVEIQALGAVKRLTAASWNAELGPTDTLRVNWPTRSQRNPLPNQVQTQSDTWIHVSEGQVVADCKLRVSGGGGLPRQLHLVLDAGWEPVGSDWNEVKMLTSELSAVGNRRIYTVNRKSVGERASIRALLVPRNSDTVSTLAVPFFSLQEGVLSSRTLALSAAGRPRWKLVGSELWSRLTSTAAELEWETNKPPLTDLWRVPTGALSGSLQRMPAAARPSVDEQCDLQLLSSGTVLTYHASWNQSIDEQSLKLEVPPDAHPREVLVNGAASEYLTSESDGRKFLLVQMPLAPTEVTSLDVQLQLTQSGQRSALPRVVLQDLQVSSSRYQVNCGAELTCKLTAETEKTSPTELTFNLPVIDTTAMLSTLTAPIATAELGSNYRDSVYLPTRYEVQQRPPANSMVNAMALTRTDQGWRATVEVLLASEESLPFAFFDIPSTIRDLIESTGSPYRVSASGVEGRATLCLLPREEPNRQFRASFAFRLPSPSSSQSLTIPEVLFLGAAPSRPVLALPTKIDDQAVRWSRAGRRLADDWLAKSGLSLASENYLFFELGDNQQQTIWTPADVESKPAEILFAWAAINHDSAGNAVGVINYWIDPNNHLDISAVLPADTELIGIQSGTSGAVWSAEQPGQVRVLMQPSYLPVHLRVYLKWHNRVSTAHPAGLVGLQLPALDAVGPAQLPIAVLSNVQLTSVSSRPEEVAATNLSLRRQFEFPEFQTLLAERWSRLLIRSLPVASDLGDDELASWLRNWNYAPLPLTKSLLIPKSGGSSSDIEEAATDTVEAFWSWYLVQVGGFDLELHDVPLPRDGESSSASTIPSSSESVVTLVDTPGPDSQWYLVDLPSVGGIESIELEFKSDLREESALPLSIATFLLVFASGLIWLLVRKLSARTGEILALHPWLYWSFLAAIGWLLLPVAWPSWLIAITAAALLAAQLLTSRRRQLALRR